MPRDLDLLDRPEAALDEERRVAGLRTDLAIAGNDVHAVRREPVRRRAQSIGGAFRGLAGRHRAAGDVRAGAADPRPGTRDRKHAEAVIEGEEPRLPTVAASVLAIGTGLEDVTARNVDGVRVPVGELVRGCVVDGPRGGHVRHLSPSSIDGGARHQGCRAATGARGSAGGRPRQGRRSQRARTPRLPGRARRPCRPRLARD